jgi:hypothetical protein
MLAPAEIETLPVVPSRVNAAVGAAPTIVMLDAPELKVIFAPATKETLLDVPFKLKLVAAGTAGPMIVIEGLVLS